MSCWMSLERKKIAWIFDSQDVGLIYFILMYSYIHVNKSVDRPVNCWVIVNVEI